MDQVKKVSPSVPPVGHNADGEEVEDAEGAGLAGRDLRSTLMDEGGDSSSARL